MHDRALVRSPLRRGPPERGAGRLTQLGIRTVFSSSIYKFTPTPEQTLTYASNRDMVQNRVEGVNAIPTSYGSPQASDSNVMIANDRACTSTSSAMERQVTAASPPASTRAPPTNVPGPSSSQSSSPDASSLSAVPVCAAPLTHASSLSTAIASTVRGVLSGAAGAAGAAAADGPASPGGAVPVSPSEMVAALRRTLSPGRAPEPERRGWVDEMLARHQTDPDFDISATLDPQRPGRVWGSRPRARWAC